MQKKDLNKEFVRLLKESVMALEAKHAVIKAIAQNAMSKEEIADLYNYLVAEEKVRKEQLPKAKEQLANAQEKIIAAYFSGIKNNH